MTDPSQYRLSQFVERSRERSRGDGLFELENSRLLDVNLQDYLWIKTGSMVAYVGQVKFEREGMLQHGLSRLLKKAVTGEGTQLTKASGRGRLYLADGGKSIQILKLENESLYVNGNDLLAFEPSIQWDINVMRHLTAVMANGLFNIRLSGSGWVAIGTQFEPVTLMVTPEQTVITDPNATVAWSGNLTPDFRTDVSFRTFLGRGGGEAIQMEFRGEGFIVIQPYEERAVPSTH